MFLASGGTQRRELVVQASSLRWILTPCRLEACTTTAAGGMPTRFARAWLGAGRASKVQHDAGVIFSFPISPSLAGVLAGGYWPSGAGIGGVTL